MDRKEVHGIETKESSEEGFFWGEGKDRIDKLLATKNDKIQINIIRNDITIDAREI